MEKEFDISRVSKSPAVFNIEKMRWMNGQHIRGIDDKRYLTLAMEEFKLHYPNVEDKKAEKILLEIRKYLETLKDIEEKSKIFLNENLEIDLGDSEISELFSNPTSLFGLEKFLEELRMVNTIEQEMVKPIFKKLSKEYGVKGPYLYKPLRLALTGMVEGPGLYGVLEILGFEKSCSRIASLIDRLKKEE